MAGLPVAAALLGGVVHPAVVARLVAVVHPAVAARLVVAARPAAVVRLAAVAFQAAFPGAYPVAQLVLLAVQADKAVPVNRVACPAVNLDPAVPQVGIRLVILQVPAAVDCLAAYPAVRVAPAVKVAAALKMVPVVKAQKDKAVQAAKAALVPTESWAGKILRVLAVVKATAMAGKPAILYPVVQVGSAALKATAQAA